MSFATRVIAVVDALFPRTSVKTKRYFVEKKKICTTTTKTTDWKTLFEEIKHGISYKTDCQDASADGDSVTCVSSGLGLGPEAIEVAIEGVKHEKDDIYPWYGSLDVVRTWMRPVLEMLF